jgi:hypothetical protein
MNRPWSVIRPTCSRRLPERRPAVAVPVYRTAGGGRPHCVQGRVKAHNRACSERSRGLICAVSEREPGQGSGDRRDGRPRMRVMFANPSYPRTSDRSAAS